MFSSIGFVVVSHDNPEQLLLLCRRLVSMFGEVPISWHHDFSRADLDVKKFPGCVRFVRPRLRTGWGDITAVKGSLRAIEDLYSRQDSPEWFALLSGACYPVAPAGRILSELQAGDCDAFLSHTLITYESMTAPGAPPWIGELYDRFIAWRLWFPGPWRGKKLARRPLMLQSPSLTRLTSPFRPGFECYGGEFWFTANRRTATRIVTPAPERELLLKYLGRRPNPEEAFYQCLLVNTPGLRIRNDDKRYIDWSGGGSHPKILGIDDVPAILKSGAHFARKFDLRRGREVFDTIDRAMDAAVTATR